MTPRYCSKDRILGHNLRDLVSPQALQNNIQVLESIFSAKLGDNYEANVVFGEYIWVRTSFDEEQS